MKKTNNFKAFEGLDACDLLHAYKLIPEDPRLMASILELVEPSCQVWADELDDFLSDRIDNYEY